MRGPCTDCTDTRDSLHGHAPARPGRTPACGPCTDPSRTARTLHGLHGPCTDCTETRARPCTDPRRCLKHARAQGEAAGKPYTNYFRIRPDVAYWADIPYSMLTTDAITTGMKVDARGSDMMFSFTADAMRDWCEAPPALPHSCRIM